MTPIKKMVLMFCGILSKQLNFSRSYQEHKNLFIENCYNSIFITMHFLALNQYLHFFALVHMNSIETPQKDKLIQSGTSYYS